MAKRPAQLVAVRERKRTRDLKAQVRYLNAALTDCMQHKVDLEIELSDGHRLVDRAQQKIAVLTEQVQQAEKQRDYAVDQCNRYVEQIDKLRRTVRTVAAFAAGEPGVDVRWSHYGRSPAETARNIAIGGVNRLLHVAARDGDGDGATETL